MANQIKTFPMSHMLIGANYSFHASVYTYIQMATAQALHIESLAATYLELINLQLNLISPNRNVAFTKELAQLDRERNLWYGQVTTAIDTATFSPDETVSAAGKKLKIAISPHRGIAGNQYNKQTSEIKAMLRDLSADYLLASIQTLNLEPTIEQLGKANNAFEEKYTQRVNTEAARPRANVTSEENSKAINRVFKEIAKVVNAFAITVSSPEIENFINQVNARIDLARNAIAHQRAGGTGNEKRKHKTKVAAEKMGKAFAKMEISKAKFKADLKNYKKAKKNYEESLS